jgi:hypothetical protein
VRGFVACRLLLLAGATPACLLYTDPINSAPTVTLVAPAVVHPFERDVYRAQASDPDGDSVTLQWEMAPGKCPISAADWAMQPRTTGDTFEVQPPNHDPFCVGVMAVDGQGATSKPQFSDGTPSNRPPAPTLTSDPPLASSFPLYTSFRITAGPPRDEDGDDLTFTWKALDPQGKDLGNRLTACDAAHPEVRCFTADQPGSYTLSVEASDALAQAKSMALTLPVLEDAAPCIEATDPVQEAPVVVLAATDLRNFEVRRVRDDGHPFPPGPHGGTTFQWFTALDRPGVLPSWTRHLGFDSPVFKVGATLFDDARPGSTYLVRVEVRDPQHDSGSDLRGCGEMAVCMVPDRCVRWVTWSVRFQ